MTYHHENLVRLSQKCKDYGRTDGRTLR